jgi:hypothetical protein
MCGGISKILTESHLTSAKKWIILLSSQQIIISTRRRIRCDEGSANHNTLSSRKLALGQGIAHLVGSLTILGNIT